MPNSPLDEQRAQKVAEVLKALCHPLRLRIVDLLCQGDLRVGELADLLQVPQAQISQQLRLLRMTGLVGVVREGGVGRYTLAEPALVGLLSCVSGCQRGGHDLSSSAFSNEE
ncbi:MAG: metalloregulator ArsR/SmtB family transcription factor [Pseudomonadota bacterium]